MNDMNGIERNVAGMSRRFLLGAGLYISARNFGRNCRGYLRRMAEIRSTGAATSETSYYGALENLMNAVGRQLKPRVIANRQIRNQGAGQPDFGLYPQAQMRGVRAGGYGSRAGARGD